MWNFFQNLRHDSRPAKLIHFRGSIGPTYERQWFRYEFSTGPALRLQFKIRPYPAATITIGFIFATLYLTFPFFRFPKLQDSRTTGFYVYHWALVWAWMERPWGEGRSTKDPWWRHFYFHIDDFFLGRRLFTEDILDAVEDVYFQLGGHEFKMNQIRWERRKYFRSRIPFSWWHRTHTYVNMKIDKPPMRAGKGENSYDCGDDGMYGISRSWPHPIEGYLHQHEERDLRIRQAIDLYVAETISDVAKYGGSNGPRGVKRGSPYRYIGRRIKHDGGMNAETRTTH